jgi:transposase
VNYTVGGTATLGTDYTGIAATPATKTVGFAAGSATAIVTVDPTTDTTIEPNETVELTLGYSRRQLIRVYRQQQRHWLQALEEAFRFWGGVPEQVLVDNARALITLSNPRTGELVINPTFAALSPPLGIHAQGLLAAPAADQGEG